MDEVRIPKQALQWKVVGFKRRPGRTRINWRDIVNKDLQRMNGILTWEEVEASDRLGVNVWPSAMLDEI